MRNTPGVWWLVGVLLVIVLVIFILLHTTISVH